ncbi:MAG: ATP-binding cassette domain-containing protein, partial [Clostridiales bacterium]
FNKGTENALELFTDFSLQVEDGQFVTIVGSNGSGKTSLFNIINGYLPMDAGKIMLDALDISDFKDYQRSQYIARVFQDPKAGSCSTMTILENMAIADNKGRSYGLQRGINRKRIPYYKEVLATLQMGLENKLDINVGSLSGGQRQALALILAMKDPRLLLLDEHTAALDPQSSANIMEITQKQIKANHVTTLMITHNLRHALAYGDRLIMMDRGKIVWDIAGEMKAQIKMAELVERFSRLNLDMDVDVIG